MAQKTDSALQTDRGVIENETATAANTAVRVGNHFEDIIDSKINNDKIVDEDDMVSNSDTLIPTQQSVKAYVDASGGGGTWGSIAGTLSSQTDLQNALDAKLAHTNAAGALTSAATIDLTAAKHTLTTALASITFTISYAGDDIVIEVTHNTTASVFTFPAGSLCVFDGTPSEDNTLTLAGVSGDKHIIAIKKIGSVYYVVSKNFTI